MSTAGNAFGLEAIGIGKRFGGFVALDGVGLRVAPGTVHALLGENGAGKSTLVKCLMGYHRPDAGQIIVAGREQVITGPRDAHHLGIGMVYQHFTLVPSMTVAENLIMARAAVPAIIDWRRELAALDEFLARTPFRVPLALRVDRLAAGERQKLEILKQLYLDTRFLILDEPTSVLTPDEADEVLGLLKGMAEARRLTVLLITHKFREVKTFADDVTVLRKGTFAGSGRAADLSGADMAAMMIGSRELPQTAARVGEPAPRVALSIENLRAPDDRGGAGLAIERIAVHVGEIVGVAGISGNGQRELMEILSGQRTPTSGRILVAGEPYGRSRAEAQRKAVNCLPEEPLRNASVARMSVADNLSFRRFDLGADGRRRLWVDRRAIRDFARKMIVNYRIKTASSDTPIGTLSGGNVQRAVLARELSGAPRVLIVANPCFGLDFQSVADIRSQIVSARNSGAAVLLVSDDLDEILELSDRVVVMGGGRIVYETPIDRADRHVLGAHMAGHAAAA